MNDDIVPELRVATVADSTKKLYSLLTEAADEIERLRVLADDLFYYLNKYPCICQLSKCKCGYDAVVESYEEVRLGEFR